MSTSNYNQKNKPIGFFDSGVGGLSVYSRFKKLLPSENTLYFGDLANLPYGNKSKEQLIGYTKKILNFYAEKDVKAVVIACNTSSAQAYESVKDDYNFRIFPIIQSCAKVISSLGGERIGVFATESTVNSGVYSKELINNNPNLKVKEIACPNWVGIVENGLYKDSKALDDIKEKIESMLEFKPSKIILGCTHYPYLLPILRQFAPNVEFIDPAEIFVKFIKESIELNEQTNNGFEEVFVSDSPEKFVQNAKIFYEVKTLPTLV